MSKDMELYMLLIISGLVYAVVYILAMLNFIKKELAALRNTQ